MVGSRRIDALATGCEPSSLILCGFRGIAVFVLGLSKSMRSTELNFNGERQWDDVCIEILEVVRTHQLALRGGELAQDWVNRSKKAKGNFPADR
jgi:hypothetical protein